MQLAERADHDLRPELQASPSGRDDTRRGRPDDLQSPVGTPSASSSAIASAFASNTSTGSAGAAQCRPGARGAPASRGAPPWPRPSGPRARRREDLPDLEQGDVGEAAVGVALRRLEQARQQARPHVGQLRRRSGLASTSSPRRRRTAPPRPCAMKRPGHRLDEAARGERALGDAGALLEQRQHAAGDGRAIAGRGSADAVDADDADDLLDEVGLALHVRRQDGGATFTRSPVPTTRKPSLLQDHRRFRPRQVEAGQALHFGPREVDDRGRSRGLAGDDDLARPRRRRARGSSASRARGRDARRAGRRRARSGSGRRR